MINGILNVYKEKGYTSHDVVAKLRGIIGQKKIGHTGTLDPDATGVLLVCLGKATKVCDLLTDKDKTYEATLLLGKTTDTQDSGGQVIREAPVDVDATKTKAAIMGFVGSYAQIPPMYSALKVGGRKLCDLARNGVEVERKPRDVTIYGLTILQMELPWVKMRIHCSKGTYIRTLCHDIGQTLGCGGCMEALTRVETAGFSLDQALTLMQIQAATEEGRLGEILYPIDSVFSHLQKATVKNQYGNALHNGNRMGLGAFLELPDPGERERIRVYDETGHFAGIYGYDGQKGDYKPIKIFWER